MAARYWQDYYQQFLGASPIGRYTASHLYPIAEPDEPASPSGPRSRAAAPKPPTPRKPASPKR